MAPDAPVSDGWINFFYLGFADVAVFSSLFVKEFRKKLRVIAVVALLAAYSMTMSTHLFVLATGTVNGVPSDTIFLKGSMLKVELEALKEAAGLLILEL